MKKYIALILVFVIQNGVSQNEITVTTDENGERITKISNRQVRKGTTLYLKGDAFLFPKYEVGMFKLKGGKEINCPMLFNLLTDEFIAKMGDEEIVFQHTDFELMNHPFISFKKKYYELL